MKRGLLVILFVVLAASTAIVSAQAIYRIKTLGILGKGIAISTTYPEDFKLIKIGIGTVTVELLGEETDLTIGVLFLDDDKFKLKDVEMGNDTASGKVFSDDEEVGSLNVSLTIKNEQEIWHGTLTVNNKNYNIYILEAERRIKPLEFATKVKNLCDEDPEKCSDIANGIGPRYCEKVEDRSCREKIEEFCEEHPDDRRCMAVFRFFCRGNLDDKRCRKELKEFCANNKDDENCEQFCEKFPNVCRFFTTTIPSTTTTTTTSTTTVPVTTTTIAVTTTIPVTTTMPATTTSTTSTTTTSIETTTETTTTSTTTVGG